MTRIEIFRQSTPRYGGRPVWDLYIDNHFVDRFEHLCDAKRIAMRRVRGSGFWHKKNRSSIYPLRYWLEEAA